MPNPKSEIIPKFWLVKTKKKYFYDISPSVDPRNMILPPFDSSQWEESNGSKIMFLGSLDAEIFAVKVILTWHGVTWSHFESGQFNLESDQFDLESVNLTSKVVNLDLENG